MFGLRITLRWRCGNRNSQRRPTIELDTRNTEHSQFSSVIFHHTFFLMPWQRIWHRHRNYDRMMFCVASVSRKLDSIRILYFLFFFFALQTHSLRQQRIHKSKAKMLCLTFDYTKAYIYICRLAVKFLVANLKIYTRRQPCN